VSFKLFEVQQGDDREIRQRDDICRADNPKFSLPLHLKLFLVFYFHDEINIIIKIILLKIGIKRLGIGSQRSRVSPIHDRQKNPISGRCWGDAHKPFIIRKYGM
ncbi:7988_t:CDS:2, partial [Funneliformis geosporum]